MPWNNEIHVDVELTKREVSLIYDAIQTEITAANENTDGALADEWLLILGKFVTYVKEGEA